MISVSEAAAIINQHPFQPKKETVNISMVVGRILAETIIADRDFPPFDRASMDGIAINFNSFQQGKRTFELEGVQAAGEPVAELKNGLNGIEIMTGAILPQNSDTVIRYEDLEIKERVAHLLIDSIERGQNIHPQAQDARKDEVLLNPGIKISPAEVALLASVGKSEVEVFNFPSTAIISTGNELVAVQSTPLAHQIRQSNSYAVQSALASLGCSSSLFHIADDASLLENELRVIFKNHELIILSGGVSKGKFDYVPQILETLGVKKHFHQVSQKPGKPFWFGSSLSNTVFALPGNPVSTYMCYYRYIQPWLLKGMNANPKSQSAILATDFTFKPPLTYFLQVEIKNEMGKLMAYPNTGGGSGDFANLKSVDGFLELPLDQSIFKAGEVFPYFSFR
jgi:molybdopterin molybdotransferase